MLGITGREDQVQIKWPNELDKVDDILLQEESLYKNSANGIIFSYIKLIRLIS